MTFRSEGVDCAARVYRPDVASGKITPCIVMASGFSLTSDDGLPAFAERFAQAGITALTFDFRHLGRSGGEPRQVINTDRQQADFGAAVSFARGLESIHADAVAVWGFSSGGGLAIYTAATDHRIAAAVALCPATDTIAFLRRMPMRTLNAVDVAILRNMLGRQRLHIPVAGRPGSIAWFSQPEALPGFDAIRGDHSPLAQRVLATFVCGGYQLPPGSGRPPCVMPLVRQYRRGGSRSPTWGCRTDRRARATRRARLVPDRSFQRFLGENFERVVAEQIEFLSRHLLTVQIPAPRASS